MLTYRNFTHSSVINLLLQPLQMGSFRPKNRKILKFIHPALNIKRTKCVSLVAYVFALNFVLSMQICKSHKQDKCYFKFNVTFFYKQAFLTKKPKILNFICHLKRGRDCFFITLYRFLPNTKNRPLREI